MYEIKWTEQEVVMMREEYQKGTSLRKISRALDRSISAIKSKASKLGLKTAAKPLLSLDLTYLRSRIKDGLLTVTELARELNISKVALFAHFKRHNYDYKQDYSLLHINKSKRRKTQGESGFNNLLRTYQDNATSRGYCFDLSEEQFKLLTKQNCHYCSIEPTQISKNNARDSWGSYTYNGVDRKDNTQGYTTSNSVACCGDCNVMKMDLSYEAFLNKINRIHQNLLEKNNGTI